MRAEVNLIESICPPDAQDYLLSRGWNSSNPGSSNGMWMHQAYPAYDFTWAEALAYENFRHLFLMKPKVGVDDTAAGAGMPINAATSRKAP